MRTPPPSRCKPSPHRLLAGAALGGFLALGLAGCTLGPDYKRPDVPLPASFRADMPSAADVANTEWWHALGDPDLDTLIDKALTANKDLVLASLRIEAMEARLRISNAAGYPQVGYSLSGERQRRSQERPNGLQPGDSPVLNNFQVSSNLTWEIDLWGRVRRANEAARAELLSTQESRRAMMLTVASAVATSYVQLVALDQRLSYAQSSLKNRQDALTLADQKFRGGSATRLSVEQARAVVEADAAGIPPIERDIRVLENALSGLLGSNPGPIQRRKIEGLALLQLPQGVPADVLARRPDVLEAEQNLVVANARIGVAKTGYFPVLSLNAILGVASDDLRWLWAETARDGNYGAGLVGTIFSAGRVDGNIREAEAMQKQAVVQFQKTVQTALVEVEDALFSRSKSGEREAALGRHVGFLREVAALARLRYEGGQYTLAEVLDAEQMVILAQGQQLQSRHDTLLALISVYKAMGGGWMVERELRDAPATPTPDVQMQVVFDDKAGK